MRKHIYMLALTFFVPVMFFCIFLILDLFYVSWLSNPPVFAASSQSSSYFNLFFYICRYTEPAGRHLPYFITLPSLPCPLQLAINEKVKMWEEGEGGEKVKEEDSM